MSKYVFLCRVWVQCTHSQIWDKISEKKSNNCKKLPFSLIYSQILLNSRAKRHLKRKNRHKNYNQIRKTGNLPKKNRPQIVYTSPTQAIAILQPYCLVCQEYGYSMTFFLLFLLYPLSFVDSHVTA